MTLLKRYVLRLFISLKYITANVVDRNNGRIVATASTVEHSIKNTLECGRSCNAKSATVVGEVLAMRLKVEGLEQGQGRGIHVDMEKEVEKKGFKNRTKIWAIVNALKNNGVKIILDEDNVNTSRPDFRANMDVLKMRLNLKEWRDANGQQIFQSFFTMFSGPPSPGVHGATRWLPSNYRVINRIYAQNTGYIGT